MKQLKLCPKRPRKLVSLQDDGQSFKTALDLVGEGVLWLHMSERE